VEPPTSQAPSSALLPLRGVSGGVPSRAGRPIVGLGECYVNGDCQRYPAHPHPRGNDT